MPRFSLGADDDGNEVLLDRDEMERERMQQIVLTRCVIDNVYPFKKFITKEEELEHGKTLQRRICYKLSVKNTEAFWEKRKEQVRRKLGRKRNNVVENVKKKMIGETGI